MGVVVIHQNHHIVHFNYAKFIVCHTSAKLFLQKQFMCLDLGEFRLLGPEGTAVFISLKAWTELSCLLHGAVTGVGSYACRLSVRSQ